MALDIVLHEEYEGLVKVTANSSPGVLYLNELSLKRGTCNLIGGATVTFPCGGCGFQPLGSPSSVHEPPSPGRSLLGDVCSPSGSVAAM